MTGHTLLQRRLSAGATTREALQWPGQRLSSLSAMRPLKAFTRAWYTQEVLRELVLIYPVYAVMMGHFGASPLELSLLLAAWSATALVFEVPTGTLADRLPRRWILVAGQILKASCFLLWWLVPSFAGFLAGFIAWGIAGSLRSGAAEALLHDKLRELGHPELFVRVYGRSEAAGAAAVTLAMALGGWAATNSYSVPLLLSVAAPLAAGLVTLLFIDEPARRSTPSDDEGYVATLKAGLSEARLSASLRMPMLYLCTAALVYEVGEEYFGPLLDEVGFSLAALGMISALTNLTRAAGAFAADRLGVRGLRGVAVLYGVAAGCLALAALASSWLSITALAVFVAISAAAKVLLQGRLQRAIESHARATITSVVGLGQELVGIPLLIGLGAIAQRSTWVRSFILLAVALLVGSLAFWWRAGRRGERDVAR